MAEIARIRTVLAGWPGDPGLSTNYYADESVLGWSVIVPALREQVHIAWELLAPYMPTAMTATLATDTDILESTTGQLIRTVTDSTSYVTTGTTEEGFLPTAVGVAVTWRTEGYVNGKHVRGRSYIIPLATNALASNTTPSDGVVSAAQAFAAAMNDGAVSYPMAVWSRPTYVPDSKPKEIDREGSAHYVTSSTVADKFAVLRSRRD